MLSNKDSYPILLLPLEVIKILNSLPPEAQKPIEPKEPKLVIPKKPIVPIKPSTGVQTYGCFILIIGVFVLVGVLGNASEIMATLFDGFSLLFLVLLIFGIYLVYNYHANGESEKREYQIKLMDYNKALKKYEKEIITYKDDYEKEKTKYAIESMLLTSKLMAWENGELAGQEQSFIDNYRKILIDSYFITQTERPSKSNLSVKKGVSELSFLSALISKSQFDFKDDLVIKFYEYHSEKLYKPDIVYYDEVTNMAIDIEIDEPYVGSTGQPIHYDYEDNKRDRFFKDNGWVTIRFAEEQIIKQQNECIEYIISVINSLREGKEAPHSNLIPVKKWSKDEAHKMAFARYRNTYLGENLREKLQHELLDDLYSSDDYANDDDLPF